jgi:RNA polymerase sigma factor (sigma-70 family)
MCVDEVLEFCRRVLGPGSAAQEAAAQARESGSADNVTILAAAARACRDRVDASEREGLEEQPAPGNGVSPSLAETVARELAEATAALPERQREALALRELLRLSYEEISRVMEIEPAAVPPLLARARLRLRVQRRGPYAVNSSDCTDSDRALRLLARRQDAETVSEEDGEWLASHLPTCPVCRVAHAAMLEASVRYRVWPHAELGHAMDSEARSEPGADPPA